MDLTEQEFSSFTTKGRRTKRERSLLPASTSSDNHYVTTEEQDMANCLILLAQGIQKKVSSVYECKTCNKTFHSFQALGGHRTSHKKIKPPSTTTEQHRDELVMVVDLDVIEFTSHHDNNNKASRVHECSICGSEFPSGQALGGHMRRHRAAAAATAPCRPLTSEVDDKGGPRNNILTLDLNLPAPDDQDVDIHHHIETNFIHVLPRPAPLVDCHY